MSLQHREGTLVIRDGRIRSATDGTSDLVGRTPAELLGTPFIDLVAPEERVRVGERYARRLRGEPVPADYEAVVLGPGGERFTLELHVELQGAEAQVRYRDVTAEAGRRPRLAALAALGAAIQRERSEAEVMARIRAELPRHAIWPVLMRTGPEALQVEWSALPGSAEQEFERLAGRPLTGFPGCWSTFSRTAWSEGVAYTDDWGGEAAIFLPEAFGPTARELTARVGLFRAVAVRLDERDGARFYLILSATWLRPDDVSAARLFATQVAAALDAARTIADLSRHNADLAALNALGALAAQRPDLPTFLAGAAAVLRGALGCQAVEVWRVDEAQGRLVPLHWEGGPPPAGPTPLSGTLGAGLRAQQPVVEEEGRRARVQVPLVARGKGIGVLVAAFEAGPDAARARLALLAAMAAHVASAVESHGLLADLRRRVGELTLLNDVAVASAQLDPVLLLGSALRRICSTLELDAAAAFLQEDERLRTVAAEGTAQATAEDAAPATVEGAAPPPGQALAAAAFQRLAPVTGRELPPGAAEAHPGFAAGLAVPLLAKRAQAVGAMVFARRAGRDLPPGEITLLSAVGVQLGVAVENARLFADVRRRLQDLQAVHAVTAAIFGAPPGDLTALLRDGCAEAARAVGCTGAAVLLLEQDGQALLGAAASGLPFDVAGIRVPFGEGLSAEVIRSGTPAWSADVTRDPRCAATAAAAHAPPLSALAAPLRSRTAIRGVLLLAGAPGRPFAAAERALAEALAGELAVAVDNARLYQEVRRRAEELTLLHEVGRSLVATLDIEQVLQAGVRNLARIVDAPTAVLALATGDGALEFRAVWGGPPEVVGRRPPCDQPGSLGALALARREPLLVEDALADPRIRQEQRAVFGARAYLVLPLLVRDRFIGTAVIMETRHPRRFEPAEVERATAVANQLAVAVENARLYADLSTSYDELARAQRQLIEQERLAALGELSAVVAHEVRNPLGVIFNSLGSLRRLLRPEGDARMLLEIVGEEADRLNRIVGDLLDFARPATPVLQPQPLAPVVDEAVAAALVGGPAVEVERELAPDLPPVPMDAHLVRQAVLNVAANAVQAMPKGGRLVIRLQPDPAGVRLEVEDTGPGIPEEVRARIFEPFFTTKATGTGLGLAVVKRIVDGHGGAVAVESRPGAGTVVRLRFPLARTGPA